MTIEIRELIIEARVIADERSEARARQMEAARVPPTDDPKLIERIVRRVLEALREQQERV